MLTIEFKKELTKHKGDIWKTLRIQRLSNGGATRHRGDNLISACAAFAVMEAVDRGCMTVKDRNKLAKTIAAFRDTRYDNWMDLFAKINDDKSKTYTINIFRRAFQELQWMPTDQKPAQHTKRRCS